MGKKISVLRVWDDKGREINIPAIQGRKGDRGDGDMNASVYDPQGKKKDIFKELEDHTHTPASLGAAEKKHTHTADDVSGVAKEVHTHSLESIGAAAAKHTHDGAEVEGVAKVLTGSYVGTGDMTFTITLGVSPKFICINHSQGMLCTTVQDGIKVQQYYKNGNEANNYPCDIAVDGNNLTVIQDSKFGNYLNAKGTVYYYTAIG